MTIETENQKSVKGRIVAAAWQLFYEKGYNGTTVDDIIDLSGTSKGSFYYYFNTKDELLKHRPYRHAEAGRFPCGGLFRLEEQL